MGLMIEQNIDRCVQDTNLKYGTKQKGKVRDIYDLGSMLLIVTTDRLSAFDRNLTNIPFKGQVLNQVSKYWFDKTQHIIQNAVIGYPNSRSVLMKKCKVFPIEFVVRGYMTGSTSTSLWTHYNRGVRNYCGIEFRDGYKKNQQLDDVVVTPTTKSDEHDVPTSPKDIIAQGLMSERDFTEASRKAVQLFKFGQTEASKHGLILVDTKYEMGVLKNLSNETDDNQGDGTTSGGGAFIGNEQEKKGGSEDGVREQRDANNEQNADQILLLDEIHTPDSSRYWFQDSYVERLNSGKEPQSVDKEFIRLWYRDNCDPYKVETLPEAPKHLIVELSKRYIYLYQQITGEKFKPEINFKIDESSFV